MRKAMAAGVICLAVSQVFAARALLAQSNPQIIPLNMHTGAWQTTMSPKYTGLPPQMAAAMSRTHTYMTCVKPEDLSRETWAKSFVGKCSSVTVLKSTGTDTDVEAKQCDAGDGMTAAGHGTFHLADSEHLSGSMDVTLSGNPFGGTDPFRVQTNYTSKWIGATCSDTD